MNNLYKSMGMQNNYLAQLAQQAKEFRKSFQGNPKEEVNKLLVSGRMTQQQFNELSQMAQQVLEMMGNI